MKYFVCLLLAFSFALCCEGASAQTKLSKALKSGAVSTRKARKAHSTRSKKRKATSNGMVLGHPTYDLDSGSVGNYFFPANRGAKWTMRITTQIFDAHSKLVRADTSFSFERVVSDSNSTLQGAPVLECESSAPYKLGGELTARTMPVTYYVDDSIVMFVLNHSMTSSENRYLLVNPLTVHNRWHDKAEDTTVTEIIATSEPVSVPYGSFKNALVVRTHTRDGDLSKYFVPGVGIAKMVYRGGPERLNGTLVVTTELIALDRGDPAHSIRERFAKKNS
jgi:hypothetical protein